MDSRHATIHGCQRSDDKQGFTDKSVQAFVILPAAIKNDAGKEWFVNPWIYVTGTKKHKIQQHNPGRCVFGAIKNRVLSNFSQIVIINKF